MNRNRNDLESILIGFLCRFLNLDHVCLSVFGFNASELKQRAVWLHSTICNIQSPNWLWDNEGNLKLFAVTFLAPLITFCI